MKFTHLGTDAALVRLPGIFFTRVEIVTSRVWGGQEDVRDSTPRPNPCLLYIIGQGCRRPSSMLISTIAAHPVLQRRCIQLPAQKAIRIPTCEAAGAVSPCCDNRKSHPRRLTGCAQSLPRARGNRMTELPVHDGNYKEASG